MVDTDKTEEVELQQDGPDEPAPKRTEEFPSLKGTKAARAEEVEQRSVDGSDGTRFVKKFITEPGVENSEAAHEANKTVVLEEAIQRGMHPRGEVRFDGAADITPEAEPGRRTYPLSELTYSVDTVPAIVDAQPVETTTPRDQIASDDGDTATPKDKPAAGAARRAEAEKASNTKAAGTSTTAAKDSGTNTAKKTSSSTAKTTTRKR